MSKPIIRVEGLSKQYRIGRREAAYGTLRESLMGAMTAPVRGARRLLSNGRAEGGPANEDRFWALRDVSFEVHPGEVVGIIGRNGAGKSTLLKVLSRITEPTEGCVKLWGRVASLLEVGTGFHPELTGRENIYLNGSILGMSRAEITRKFDEIVAFAEVDQFLDTPVKRYSSGMYVRLAFAVAAHLEPEVLVVDEVLAVGDANFQKKCLGKMSDVAQAGRTVLFVSHNMGAVQGLCDRTVRLDRGRVVADGTPQKVVADYFASLSAGFLAPLSSSEHGDDLKILSVSFREPHGNAAIEFPFGTDIQVEVRYQARVPLPRPYFWVAITCRGGALMEANMLLDGVRPECIEGEGVLSCTFLGLTILPGTYTVLLGARRQDGVSLLVRSGEVGYFIVVGTATDVGYRSEVADSFLSTASPFFAPYEWRFPDGRVERVGLSCARRSSRE